MSEPKYQEPRKCNECYWAKDLKNAYKELFECHYNAPICLHGVGAGYEETIWSIVNPDDFCSKFESKTPVGSGMK